MDLVKLLNDLVANIAALQAQLIDAEASAQALSDLKLAEGKEMGFAEGKVQGLVEGEAIGFQKGVDSVVIPPVDMTEVEALKAKVFELEQKVLALEADANQVPALLEKIAKYEAAIQVEIEDAAVDSSRLEAFKQSL